MSRKLRASLLGFKLISGRLMGIQYRTCAGPSLFLNGHAPSEDASPTLKDTFWQQMCSELQEWPASLPAFVVGDMNVRWEHQLPHEYPHVGPWTSGKGKAYLESRPMLDNRSRAWECLVHNQMVDLNSYFKEVMA